MNCRGPNDRYLSFFQIHPHQFVTSRNPELSSPDLASQFPIKSLLRNQDDQTQKVPAVQVFRTKFEQPECFFHFRPSFPRSADRNELL